MRAQITVAWDEIPKNCEIQSHQKLTTRELIFAGAKFRGFWGFGLKYEVGPILPYNFLALDNFLASFLSLFYFVQVT